MENYQPLDVTQRARAMAAAPRKGVRVADFFLARRIPLRESIDPRRGQRERSAQARDFKTVLLGAERIDLGYIEQLVDSGQTRALAAALLYAREHYVDDSRPLAEILACVERDIEQNGLSILADIGQDLVRFRSLELAAALNRLRSLRVCQTGA